MKKQNIKTLPAISSNGMLAKVQFAKTTPELLQVTNFEMHGAIVAIKALEMMHKDRFMARAKQYLVDAEYKKELKYMKSIRKKFEKELAKELRHCALLRIGEQTLLAKNH